MAVSEWATCMCVIPVATRGSTGARWAAKNGGVGRPRAAPAQLTRTCVFVWLLPAEARARVGVGGLGGVGMGGLPSAWGASVCVCQLWPAAVWARGGAGVLGGSGVCGLPAAAEARSGAFVLGGGGVDGLLFCRLGLI